MEQMKLAEMKEKRTRPTIKKPNDLQQSSVAGSQVQQMNLTCLNEKGEFQQRPIKVELARSEEGNWTVDFEAVGCCSAGIGCSALPKPHTREQAIKEIADHAKFEATLFPELNGEYELIEKVFKTDEELLQYEKDRWKQWLGHRGPV